MSVEPSKLEDYDGRFLVNPDRVLTITHEGRRLFAEPTASPKFELFAVSESTFVRKDVNIRYTFVKSAGGTVDSVRLNVNEVSSDAPRLAKDAKIPYELLMAGNLAEAVEGYKRIKAEKPTNSAVQEARLNDLGYSFLGEKRTDDAIAVFRVNVELYPGSANTYDSLAEAYMAKGEKQLAIANYQKSLELDPKNTNAAKMLKKLQE